MYIIDRFEGDWAVIEFDQRTFNIPRELLPSSAREGDILNIEITINEKAALDKKQKLNSLFNDLF